VRHLTSWNPAKAFEFAEDYPSAVFCHLWAAQFEIEAGHAKEGVANSSNRAACGCGSTPESEHFKRLREAAPKRRSKPIERAAQITLEQKPDMADKPNLVAAFYQNAGNIFLSERDNLNAAKCLRIGARSLKEVDKTRAAIFYMESCNLILPPSAEVAYVPPNARADFLEALEYMLAINKLALEPNRWLTEALSLLRRLCFILDHEGAEEELYPWFLADVVLLLTLPDVDAADEALATHEKVRSYKINGAAMHRLAEQLVLCFRAIDDKLLEKVQTDTC